MHLLRSLLIFFTFAFVSTSVVVAQQNYPPTFLWRISGNGLVKPSYVYGTMHLQDRRLFFFGDSIYKAIESSEGFSLEINPGEMMDSMFRTFESSSTDRVLLKDFTDGKTFKKLSRTLSKKLKMPADQITVKDLKRLKSRRQKEKLRKDDMDTFMDMYLYGIAVNLGKIPVGIEDVSDQLNLSDELGRVNLDAYTQEPGGYEAYLEKMKETYIKRDLNGINENITNAYSDSGKDIILLNRNLKMALRMDSLSRIRKSFFAVGVAHLPGEGGLLQLLEQKGFRVDPVLSSNYMAPEAYTYTVIAQPWVSVSDTNNVCTVEMPGKPLPIVVEQRVPMKMHIDLVKMHCYGLAVSVISPEEAASSVIFEKLEAAFKKPGMKILAKKNMTGDDFKGLEMTVKSDDENYLKFRWLVKGNSLVILVFGTQKKEGLESVDGAKFLSSVKFQEKMAVAGADWNLFTDDRNAFSVKFPSRPLKSPKNLSGEGVSAETYAASDPSDGRYYMIQVISPDAGFYIQSDSSYFETYREKLKETTGDGLKAFSLATFSGFEGASFEAMKIQENTEVLLTGRLIRRDERVYAMIVASPSVGASAKNITDFFDSFSALPYQRANWNTQTIDQEKMLIRSPAAFVITPQDSSLYSFDRNKKSYTAFDEHTSSTYFAESRRLSAYFWNNSDSAYFRSRAETFKGPNDSIVRYEYLPGSLHFAEVLLQLSGGNTYKKVKLMVNGDTEYDLYALLPKTMLLNSDTKEFFESARFAEQLPNTLFENKMPALTTALKSSDSAIAAEARKVLQGMIFLKSDLPALYSALLHKYTDSTAYEKISDLIVEKIITLHDSSVVPFVRKNYSLLNDSNSNSAMQMLTLLANDRSAGAGVLIKKLLLENPPQSGNVFKLYRALSDSLSFAKELFPEVTKLYDDTVTGPAFAAIAELLSDSNAIAKQDILVNEAGLQKLANKQLNDIRKDREGYPLFMTSVVNLLAGFKTESSNDILSKIAAEPMLWLKSRTLIALLKNGASVPREQINAMAENREWRVDFFDMLKTIDRQDLFPKAFYTQEKFAESYMSGIVVNDYEYEIISIEKIGERTASVRGIPVKFYLFKIKASDGEAANFHLGVCGAFDAKKSSPEMLTDQWYTTFYTDEIYSKNKVSEKFRAFIEEMNANKPSKKETFD